MRIGVLRETKDRERRVALVPDGVRTLVGDGHEVWVEAAAGEGSGFADAEYVAAGAHLARDAAELIASSELVTKVKEPTEAEVAALGEGQGLFCFLHLAPEPKLAERLVDSGAIAIAYEHVERADGSLPLLAPMSAIAGRVALQIGAHLLQADQRIFCRRW